MGNFEKYKDLKEKLNISYKGICLNRILAVPIWSLANDKSSFCISLKQFALLFLSINVHKLVFDPNEHSILSTFGRYNRKDHLQLYESVINRLDGKASYNNTLEFGWKISIHPITGIKIMSQIFKCLEATELKFIEKLILSALSIHYCNIIEELEKMDFSKVKKYLSMCSVLDFENLLTQYMKKQGIPTYSLQEGIYFVFKTNPPVDSIQYENFETDNLLCWGQFSVDEDTSYGISSKRLCVGGYPKVVRTELFKGNNTFKKCMVLVARDSFSKTNMALLSILEKMSSIYVFDLKLHPSCDYLYYSQYTALHNMGIMAKDKTVNECLNNEDYDFCIAVNTTAYYEALMRGLPCLRYCDGSFDLMAGYDDVFCTIEEFESCIDRISMLSLDEYQRKIDDVLRYAIGMGLDNYNSILCS